MEENIKKLLDDISISNEFHFDKSDDYSSLLLAYMGDAVFEIIVRSYMLKSSDVKISKIHKDTIKIVCAKTQSNIIMLLEDKEILTEEEYYVYKKGRNAKTHSK